MLKLPRYFWKTIAAIFFIAAAFLAVASFFSGKEQGLKQPASPSAVMPGERMKEERLIEDKRVYENHTGNNLEHVYITIFDQSQVKENDITFYDLNESYKQYSNLDDGPKLNILFQTGTEEGPKSNGFVRSGENVPNASIELRGRSSRLEAQKSYKIKLYDNGGLWFGQKVLNLNKHSKDSTRVQNKLAFDYFRLLPDFISLRTNFVQLHVKDMTSSGASGSFEDYGLYTHIEQLNEEALAARGLNPDGNLYKAENFEFHRYPDKLLPSDNPKYDKKTFESVLKINGNENHDELLKMLNDVNNMSLSFDEVFHKYFQEDNYLTWLAVNLLLGNYDTMSTNYYLYSPLNSEKWYFLPWDYDKALGYGFERKNKIPDWQLGIQRYWGTVLHRRYLRDPGNVEKLVKKMEEISAIINEEANQQLLDGYHPIVKPFLSRNPDLYYLPYEFDEFEGRYRAIEKVTDFYKDQFKLSLQFPMPIFLHYEREDGKDLFRWEPSYDLQGDALTYDFVLGKDPDLSTRLVEKKNLKDFSLQVPALPPGRYYWRVIVKDAKGNTQIPFDFYSGEERNIDWGIQQIIVPGEVKQ